jgi:putative SOS response-associated peptidase YedK
MNSFTIITTKSNELTASVHERMPVILNEQEFSFWMEPEVRPSDIMELLYPYPSDEMHLFRVSTLINNVANQQEDVAEPLAETE